MRVLHVYRTYYPDSQGGLEEVIRQICMNSNPDAVESRVFTLTGSKSDSRSHVPLPEADVYRAKLSFEIASCGVSAQAIGDYSQHVEWADVVHYHFPWPFADVLHFASRVNKPTLLTYHSDIVRQRFLGTFYKPLMHRFLSSVDKIICTSPNYFATSDVLREYSEKVEVVPIGIDATAYPKSDPAIFEEVENRFGRDFFLFVGVLRYYKGLHILLDAIKDAPFKVVIAGSGPIEQELMKQAHSQKIRNVYFTGFVSNEERNALFELCRGVVFPSYLRSEAFGVTLLEGAMFGKPLISTEVGSGTSHVNLHQETGLVVPPGSSKGLRRAMDRLWNNPEEAKAMGLRARERYNNYFTGALMGKRYTKIYNGFV
ncbi:MAG: glycosyltransferase [Pseudomonadota bacterium]